MRSSLLCATISALSLCAVLAWARSPGTADAVDAEVDAIIKAMCDHLSALRTFSLETETAVEDVLDSGQKLEFSHRRSAVVRRPGQLRVESRGDLHNRTYWKDGRTLSVADHDHRVYAQVEVPESIDEAMDYLAEHYDMSLPLADLLSADPHAIFIEKRRNGFRVGLHEVDGHPCHHLAFTQEDVDWQIWIDAGDVPVPRKIVITYKNEPSCPRFSAILRNLRAVDIIGGDDFRFAAPEGYEKIDVLERDGGEEGK